MDMMRELEKIREIEAREWRERRFRYRVNDPANFYHGYAVESVERTWSPANRVFIHLVRLTKNAAISLAVREERLIPQGSIGT